KYDRLFEQDDNESRKRSIEKDTGGIIKNDDIPIV
ncbi:unnamed protein product, partial [Didymodactylos carnosus]